MTDLKTDEEKAEEIKAWWKENGTSVIAGVAVAIAGIFGWQQWQEHRKNKTETASSLYANVADNAENIATLKAEHDSSPYAALAGLASAKSNAAKGDEASAIEDLRWVIDNASEANIKQTAQLRLVRLLIANQQLDEAGKLLEQDYISAYNPVIDELKGDLHLANKDVKSAAEAYRRAIFQSGGNPPRYLQMKLDSLGNGV